MADRAGKLVSLMPLGAAGNAARARSAAIVEGKLDFKYSFFCE